jgi:hypothetical protein
LGHALTLVGGGEYSEHSDPYGPFGPLVRTGQFAGHVFEYVAAPVMAAADTILGRPFATTENALRDITGKEPLDADGLKRQVGNVAGALIPLGGSLAKIGRSGEGAAAELGVAAPNIEAGAADRGLIFVSENLGEPSRGQVAARNFEAATEGAYSDVATQQRQVPALRYTNPNPNGAPYVKFDGFRRLDDGTIELIDAKTRLVPYSTVDGPVATKSVADGLTRQRVALAQNPGYTGVLEFPTQAAADEANVVLRRLKIENIGVRVRQ